MAHLLLPFVLIAHLFHYYWSTTPYERMVDRVSASVVRITGETETWMGRADYICTGEVIEVHRVLTAAHCVGSNMRADGLPMHLLLKDEHSDLALLAVDSWKSPITLRDTPVVRFEPLTAIGYGWGLDRLSVLSVHAFLIGIRPDDDMAPGLLVQGSYIGGMSGGPIVDEDGHMVGIVQQSNQGVGYGVGTLTISAFLLGTD